MTSDDNGGYIIRKSTFALILCLIALLSCIVTVVAYGVTIKSDVDHLKETLDQAALAGPIYQTATNDKLIQHEIAIVVNQEKILAINEDIAEIKSGIKELLSK